MPTPERLAQRMARTLPADVPVLDPACGEGELLLAALRTLGPRASRLSGIEIDPLLAERARERLRAAAAEAGATVDIRVDCADALDERTSWPAAWVLANPPWLSFSGRHAGPRTERRGARPGWPSLQAEFLERIAGHVARHRVGAAVLLPGGVTELDRYGPLRARVTAAADLDGRPEELGEHAFPGVCEPAVLLRLAAPRSTARRKGSALPWRRVGAADAAALAELGSFPRLPARSFGDPGVHSGNSARELVLPADHVPSGATTAALRQGRDLHPFDLGRPSASLRLDLPRTDERRFRIGPLERYRSFPILLRQTADRIVAALHRDPGYFRNSLLACRDVPGLDPAFIVAILNGPVATAWHRMSFRDARQRTFPQVKVGHLATQPFPIADRGEDPALHDRLARAVRALDPSRADFESKAAELCARSLEAFALSDATRARVREVQAG